MDRAAAERRAEQNRIAAEQRRQQEEGLRQTKQARAKSRAGM